MLSTGGRREELEKIVFWGTRSSRLFSSRWAGGCVRELVRDDGRWLSWCGQPDCSSHHYHHYQYPPLSPVNSHSTLPYSSPQPSALYCNLSQPHPHQLNHRPSSLTSSLTQPPAHLLENNRLLLVPQNTIFSNSSLLPPVESITKEMVSSRYLCFEAMTACCLTILLKL